jgi:hypothetical protein
MCNEILRDAVLATGADPGAFLLTSLLRWQKLLALGAHGLLGEGAQQGLFGELHLLKRALGSYGTSVALDAWVGPSGAPQDFSLPIGLVEVKSIRAGTREVSISSIEQLDGQHHPLFLNVMQLTATTGAGTDLTLYGMVSEIRRSLAGDIIAAVEFERKLVSAGYRDCEAYDQRTLAVTAEQWYRVDANFPCLRRKDVAPGITSAVYRINLSAISGFAQRAELT